MYGTDNSSFPQDNSFLKNSERIEYSMNNSSSNFVNKENIKEQLGSSSLNYNSNIMYNDEYTYPYNADMNQYENETKEINSSKGSVFLPRYPKVFSRRIQGKKSDIINESYISNNNNIHSNQYESNNKNSLNKHTNLVKRNSQNRNITDCSKLSPRLRENSSEMKRLYRSSENLNMNSLLDVPLCVQESGSNIQHQYKFMPMHSINQDEYYFHHYLNNNTTTTTNSFKISPEKLVKVIQILFKCMFKTLKLVIVKIQKEFDTKEFVSADYKISSLPNLDVACDVCEKTEEERYRLGINNGDGFSYFEEPDHTSKFIKKLWGTINDWIDKNEKDPIIFEKIKNKKNDPDVFYKVGKFPKDENGKVELPTFEKISKKN